MEAAGAVFLPAAGYRDTDGYGTSLVISGLFQDDIGTGDDHLNPKMGAAPDNGRSVRLVHKLGSGGKFSFSN